MRKLIVIFLAAAVLGAAGAYVGAGMQAPPSITEAAKYLFGKKSGETVRLNLIVPWRRGNLTGYREAEAKLSVR